MSVQGPRRVHFLCNTYKENLQRHGINEFCLPMGFSLDFKMDPEKRPIHVSVINKCHNELSSKKSILQEKKRQI